MGCPSHVDRRWTLRAAMWLSLLLASTACRPAADAGGDGPTLRIGVGIGSSVRDSSVEALTDVLYSESLLMREWDGRATGRLAHSFTWEDGARVLRLRLKPGIVLHDGTTLDAPLAAETLRRSAPESGAKRPWYFENVTSIEAPDAETIVIRLAKPDIFLLNGLSDQKIVRPDVPDVGTGPFRIVSREPVVTTSRFDRYHGGPSALGGVSIVTYDTPRSVWAALMRGEVDAAQEVSREAVEFMERSSNVETFRTIQPFYVSVVFNVRHPALGNTEVRRALSEGLDRTAIVERALRGRGREADVPIWPFHWAYAGAAKPLRFNPASARLRLTRAGWPQPADSNSGEFRSRFKFRCMVYNQDPQYERIALMVQRQLFDIGVDMQIDLVDLNTLGERAAKGEFDAFLMRLNAGRSLDFTYRFWHSSLPNQRPLQNSGYSGADDLLDRVRQSTTEDETRQAVAALARRFEEDAPAAFIAWLEVTRAVSSRFSVGENSGPDPFGAIWQWQPAISR